MKYFALLYFIAGAFFPLVCLGQDYFEDADGSGMTILSSKLDHSILSTRLNIGDNSIKINFFQQYPIDSARRSKMKDTTQNHGINFDLSYAIPDKLSLKDIGWGMYVKGKTEDKLGAAFANGEITPGFDASGYLSYRVIRMNVKQKSSDRLIILLFGNYSLSDYQLIQPIEGQQSKLSDTTFNGYGAGLSFIYQEPSGRRKKDDIFLSASLEIRKKNNYSSLDKVEVKKTVIEKDTLGNQTMTVTEINDNGDIYGKGTYREFWLTQFRVNVSYIPSFLENKVAFLVYPSVGFSSGYNPQFGIGAGIQILKKGSPSVSQGGIYVELKDVTNALGSNKSFVKRSLTVGIVGSLNIFTQKQKQ